MNIMICTGITLIIGGLFGGKGLIGYLSGLNLVGVHIKFLNLLRS